MAGIILVIGKLAFAAMGVAIGFRLASMLRSEGALGLHTVALAAICVGGIGLILDPVSTALRSMALTCVGEAGVRGGMLLFCYFLARTFRPNPLGYVIASLCGIGLVASIVWDLGAQPSQWDYDYSRISSHANQLSIAIPFLWATGESALLWHRGRKQLAIGLSDPLVVARYMIWCFATACFVGVAMLAVLGGTLAGAGHLAAAELAQGMRGVLYLALTGAIWWGLFRRTPDAAGQDAHDAH